MDEIIIPNLHTTFYNFMHFFNQVTGPDTEGV